MCCSCKRVLSTNVELNPCAVAVHHLEFKLLSKWAFLVGKDGSCTQFVRCGFWGFKKSRQKFKFDEFKFVQFFLS
jgi:hypothetical protein